MQTAPYARYSVYDHTTSDGVDIIETTGNRPLCPDERSHSSKRYVITDTNGIYRSVRIDEIRLRAFYPPTEPDKTRIKHKDGDIRNDDLSNLEWATTAECVDQLADGVEWRTVPGFSNYVVLKHTNSKGVDAISSITMKPLTVYTNNHGYNTVSAKDDKTGRIAPRLLSRLRLISFIGPPPHISFTADHIDRNKTNDDLDNLRWSSKRDQMLNRNTWSNRGRKLAIRKTHLTTGEVHKYASVWDVPGMRSNVVYSRIRRPHTDKEHEWRYDCMQLVENEEIRHVTSNLYVTNFGRLARKTKHGFVECKANDNSAYPSVTISGKSFLLHRVVYETFMGPIKPFHVIDHIDSDRNNFRLDNLREVTTAENNMLARGLMYRVENKLDGSVYVVTGDDAHTITGLNKRSVYDLAYVHDEHKTWSISIVGKYKDFL